MNPGAVPLSIVFAGSVGYGGSAASVLVAIHRDDTALVYTGPAGVATGQPQTVTAVLTDAQSHAPLAGKTVTFTFGSVTASGTTDATGTATATLALPASVPTGPAVLQVAFAGDAGELPAATTAPVVVYQPASFVIWGGNTPGLALGQYVNFWGSQWASQVTGGDYQANPSFKGFAIPAATPIAICEPTAHTSGSPQLDASCWTSKPGNSKPPATLSAYIGVIVSTSIAKQGSTIYGNVAALVVVQVDPGSPYGSDPGHPGFGTVATVIQDGASLFPHAASRRALATAEQTSSSAQTTPSEVRPSAPGQPVAPAAVANGNHRFFFYSPELHLLAESELTTSASPAILNEYIWFAGQPVAQSDNTGTTSWTFTDHLGTPILQTSAAQGVSWRAEYEPYGAVFNLRSPDQHQPLRLPGQEAEQLSLGANGATSRSYNIHRWYDSSRGRYSAFDPLARTTAYRTPYAYALDNPLAYIDPRGLYSIDPSCKGCPNPVSMQDKRTLADIIKKETDVWCATRLGQIKDVAVRSCIQQSCKSGKVDCSDCNNHEGYSNCGTLCGWLVRSGVMDPIRTAHLCGQNQVFWDVPGEAGDTVIHEWAHGCGYDPDDGSVTGVPGSGD
jgi:RHS repeat-associated protein